MRDVRVVTNVGPAMRWTWHVAARVSRADERHDADGEIVWSWRPGAGAKVAVLDEHAIDGGNQAGPRGEHV